MQAFLYIDFFIVGLVVALAWRYAQAHFWPDKHDLEKQHHEPENPHLSPVAKQQLMEEAERKFKKILEEQAEKFRQDLESNESLLVKQLDTLSDQVVQKELDHYKAAISKLEEQAQAVSEGATSELSQKQRDFENKLNEDLEAEKKHLIEQIDSKLADAVLSFLLDSLGHNVDLGSQTNYLTSVLEEHKDEFKQGVSDEAPTAG